MPTAACWAIASSASCSSGENGRPASIERLPLHLPGDGPAPRVVDQRHPGDRVEVGGLPTAEADGKVARRRIVRALTAPLGILRRPHARRHPHAALPVHHRVVHVGRRVHERLVAPERRRLEPVQREVGGRLRVAHRHLSRRRPVADRNGEGAFGSGDPEVVPRIRCGSVRTGYLLSGRSRAAYVTLVAAGRRSQMRGTEDYEQRETKISNPVVLLQP